MPRSTLLLVILSLAYTMSAHAAQAPNVVIFLADDLGWGDLGCYGHPEIKSPNLDAFAQQGVRLTQCYAASAVCSPSRSAILTGRTPFRNGVYTWIPEGSEIHLRTSEITLPTLLKQAGYTTCHVGKWHLNGHFNKPTQPQPNDHGYDWWLATQNNAAPSHMNPINFVRNGQPIGKVDGYSAPFIVDEAIMWLKEKRDPNKPFLLCVWTHEPHYPIKSDPAFKAYYPNLSDDVQIEHHANVTQLDHAFGDLMQALNTLKLADSTMVIFTADNGPEGDGIKSPGRGSTGGLRGRKRSMYEGGIRVPGIVRWPGVIAHNTTSAAPVIGSDFFVTALRAAGVNTPTDRVLDGCDVRAQITGQGMAERSRPMYWRYGGKVAMRLGDYKLVVNDGHTQWELYNLVKDKAETNDLSTAEPEQLAIMQKRFHELNKEIETEGPDWPKKRDKKTKDE